MLSSMVLLAILSYCRGSPAVLVHPRSINISYGGRASFFCSVRVRKFEGVLYWLANNEPARREGILIDEGPAVNNIQNSTLTVNGSFYEYNNMKIQCGVLFNQSRIAILQINAPSTFLNLSVSSRSINFIMLSWVEPPRLTLQPGDVNILNYVIIIEIASQNNNTQTNISLSGNETTYLYRPLKNYDYCSYILFCITPIRSAGVVEAQECIRSSFKRAFVVDGPTEPLIVLQQGKHYINISATVTCSDISLVLWMSNGQPLHSSSNLHFQTSSDYTSSCDTSENNGTTEMSLTYTESLVMEASHSPAMQLHIISLFTCSEDLKDCIPSVCFSRSIQLLRLKSQVTPYYKEESPVPILCQTNTTVTSYTTEVYILIGASLVLGTLLAVVFAACTLLFIFYWKLKKDSQKIGLRAHRRLHHIAATIPDHYEDIYEQCGGPTSKTEATYDKPKTPSPQPNMQPCEAYSTLPAT